MIEIKLPLSVYIGKKKHSLSMNVYRNLHYRSLSKIKKDYDGLLSFDAFKADKIRVNYDVYFKDKRKRDVMNFVSVADKFFLDCLVKRGCIPDDNYNIVSYGPIEFMGYAEENYIIARVEVIE